MVIHMGTHMNIHVGIHMGFGKFCPYTKLAVTASDRQGYL
jgi:hypothetical protein